MASISETKLPRANLRPFLTPFTKPHTPHPLHYWLTLSSLCSLWGCLENRYQIGAKSTPNYRCWHWFGISRFQSQIWSQISAKSTPNFRCWYWFGISWFQPQNWCQIKANNRNFVQELALIWLGKLKFPHWYQIHAKSAPNFWCWHRPFFGTCIFIRYWFWFGTA